MPGTEKPSVGYLKKIVIENVTGADNFRQGSLITGIRDHCVEDVIIRNYKISMEGGGDSTMIRLPVDEKEGGYPDAQGYSRTGLPSFGFYLRHAKRVNIKDASITSLNPDARPCYVSGGDVEAVVVNEKEIQ
jgi:hypothetical protein